MPIDRRSYGRQIRLSEIGESGQAKLSATEVVLGSSGFARTIEERYTRAAGMGTNDPPARWNSSTREGTVGAARARDTTSWLDPFALGLRHEAAREVAEGALRALVHVHDALGLGRGES